MSTAEGFFLWEVSKFFEGWPAAVKTNCVCSNPKVAVDGWKGIAEADNMSRIYVGRLSYNAREKDVERFFRGFGRIKDINLKNGFGFVVSPDIG